MPASFGLLAGLFCHASKSLLPVSFRITIHAQRARARTGEGEKKGDRDLHTRQKGGGKGGERERYTYFLAASLSLFSAFTIRGLTYSQKPAVALPIFCVPRLSWLCVCVCVCVRMYVCMCVCVFVFARVCGWMDKEIDTQTPTR